VKETANVTYQEHQVNGDLVATEKIALYVNGALYVEYTVSAGTTGKVTFSYQEIKT